MTEILLVGTFHFMESPIDFYSSEIQNDLELLVKNLLQFKPDAVAVEAAVNAQISVDESYQKFEKCYLFGSYAKG